MANIKTSMSMPDSSSRFYSVLFQISSGLSGSLVLPYSVISLMIDGDIVRTLFLLIIVATCAIAFVFARRGMHRVSGYFLITGIFLGFDCLVYTVPENLLFGSSVYGLLLMLAAFSLDRRYYVILSIATAIFVLSVNIFLVPHTELSFLMTLVQLIILTCFITFSYVLALHTKQVRTSLQEKVTKIQSAMPSLSTAGERVASAAATMLEMATKQRQGATNQSTAVDETRGALSSTLTASQEISDAAKSVNENAEAASQNGEEVVALVKALAGKTQQMTEILDTIKKIANTSELLALNASLEGTRAGEAGRGFSLVASRLKSLAGDTSEAVKKIRAMTEDISTTMNQTESSLKEATEFSLATSSSTRQISLVTLQQRASMEEVANAMADIVEIAGEVDIWSEKALSSAGELRNVSGDLVELLGSLSETQDVDGGRA